MWLTLLWQNKGILLCVFVVLLVGGLSLALKIQNDRLTHWKTTAETAIEQHDQWVNEYAKQKRALDERDGKIKIQEEENAKLHKTLAEAVKSNRAWAGASIPSAVVRVLQTLPETSSGTPATPDKPDPGAIVPRADKRRFTLLGDRR